MLTFSISTSAGQRISPRTQQRTPRGIRSWTECQTEILEHLTVLEQVTMAVLEGYLSGPRYDQAAHAGQRLLALTEMRAWREGTRGAEAQARLFCPAAAFGLVQAVHLSELLAAFYRERAQVSARQLPAPGRDVAWPGGPDVPHHLRGYRYW